MAQKNKTIDSSKILDFNQKKQQNVEEKRRTYERIMFKNLMGVYSVVEDQVAIFPIELVDISLEGCLIQIPWSPVLKEENSWRLNQELKLRLYFTKGSYLPALVKIKRVQEYVEKGQSFLRYGLEFDRSVPTFEALKIFIQFLYKYAELSSIDHGDVKALFI